MPQCSRCGEANTMNEEEVLIDPFVGNKLTPIKLAEVDCDIERFSTGIPQVDELLGGGFASNSVTLFSSDPGIGKSTLTLQICDNMLRAGKKILYAAGEEAPSQIANRAKRLNVSMDLAVLNSTTLEDIVETARIEKPNLLVIDSIQCITSPRINGRAGNVNQIRHASRTVMNLSKNYNIAVLIICHVIKDGNTAGPKTLAHDVDVLLKFEGEKGSDERKLYIDYKNRFGPSDREVYFQMTDRGLIPFET